MPLISEQTVTREAFLRLPDSVAYELVDGHLVERHVSELSSRVAARIICLLEGEAAKTGEAFVYGPDLTYDCFGSDGPMRRADVSVIRSSRLKGHEDLGYVPIPADLVVEVLSPNDEAYEVNRKVEDYLSAGFPLVWVVDPSAKIVFVHRPGNAFANKLREADEIAGEGALPSFRCLVSDFFRR